MAVTFVARKYFNTVTQKGLEGLSVALQYYKDT